MGKAMFVNYFSAIVATLTLSAKTEGCCPTRCLYLLLIISAPLPIPLPSAATMSGAMNGP